MSSFQYNDVVIANVPLPIDGGNTNPVLVTGTTVVSGPVTIVQPSGTNLHVDVDNFPPTYAVTGTFWQATQPVSIAATVNTFVTNFPATQPVSGTVAVSNFPASQAVTGTFWQTTQPVSGTVTATPPALLGTFAAGQTKISVTGTAVQLASNALTTGVILTASLTNVNPSVIGDSGVTNTTNGSGNGYILSPGASVSVAVSNTNVLYVNGTANDVLSFIGN